MSFLTSAGLLDTGGDISAVGDHQYYVKEGSGQSLNDEIGSIDATKRGATWRSSSSATEGYYLDLDGIDDDIITDSTVGANEDQVTTFGWFRPRDFSSFDRKLFNAGGDHDGNSNGWYLDTEDTDGQLLIAQGSGSALRNVPFVSSGNWGFVAVRLNNNSVRVITWDNSQELADQSTTGNSRTRSNDPLYVGSQDGSYDYFDGDVDFWGCANSLISKSDLETIWQETQR